MSCGSSNGQASALLFTNARDACCEISSARAVATTRIRAKSIFGSTLMDNEVSRASYEEFLPLALAEAVSLSLPTPRSSEPDLKAFRLGSPRKRKA